MLLGPGYYHSFCFMGILWADNDNGDPMAHEDIVWTSPSSDIDFISIIAQKKKIVVNIVLHTDINNSYMPVILLSLIPLK